MSETSCKKREKKKKKKSRSAKAVLRRRHVCVCVCVCVYICIVYMYICTHKHTPKPTPTHTPTPTPTHTPTSTHNNGLTFGNRTPQRASSRTRAWDRSKGECTRRPWTVARHGIVSPPEKQIHNFFFEKPISKSPLRQISKSFHLKKKFQSHSCVQRSAARNCLPSCFGFRT